jgi:tripartite-type tricarboxylate transporter receptor subunit TctC
MMKVDVLEIPYKGTGPALNDLVSGQFDYMVDQAVNVLPQIKSGNIKALGVSTTKRLSQLPDVPTIDEAGVKGYDMGYWFAAYVPAHTPAPVVARLNELLHAGLKTPAAKAFFETSGGEPFPTTPEQLAKFQAEETQKWGKVIKAAGIEPE